MVVGVQKGGQRDIAQRPRASFVTLRSLRCSKFTVSLMRIPIWILARGKMFIEKTRWRLPRTESLNLSEPSLVCKACLLFWIRWVQWAFGFLLLLSTSEKKNKNKSPKFLITLFPICIIWNSFLKRLTDVLKSKVRAVICSHRRTIITPLEVQTYETKWIGQDQITLPLNLYLNVTCLNGILTNWRVLRDLTNGFGDFLRF